ncbi:MULTISPECIES: hypothetical protein [unclassified Streptomyces]|uniref:hypothetical protein n=1 Tax=unclassified Streptomyces TaxID=2593676 RepID=UPI002DDA9FF7|nr:MULTISPECIES: hypothetical protein [unclassified Streptomyces]WSA93927.1 hypothetical protein OIE63_21825 [Streptomyces sp. NBC_01795]WSB78352.1 hypothetical protein OHB04_22950 [Streptomyces sp. NBC_01775]WSS13444.1 hypothetical protein OG533_17285 [Streptomyces sp. NBC_01186]WSS42234.1 hypothetical protein OG220_17850 [Streptomyces sp. NBC_01187]
MSQQVLGQGRTTSAEAFWYVLGCLAFGASYFSKVPVKKALSEYGLVERTSAEKFWYVVMNIAFGSGYLSKVITKKALSEVLYGDISTGAAERRTYSATDRSQPDAPDRHHRESPSPQ